MTIASRRMSNLRGTVEYDCGCADPLAAGAETPRAIEIAAIRRLGEPPVRV